MCYRSQVYRRKLRGRDESVSCAALRGCRRSHLGCPISGGHHEDSCWPAHRRIAAGALLPRLQAAPRCLALLYAVFSSSLSSFSGETQLEITRQSKITKTHILSKSLFQEERRLCVKKTLTSEVRHQKNVLHGLNRSIHFSYMHRFTLTPVRLSYEHTLFT